MAYMKMSVLLKDMDEAIVGKIRDLSVVKEVEIAKNSRINLRIDSFNDQAINNILEVILSSGGVIESVFTQEPSLEDVFIKSTSEESQ